MTEPRQPSAAPRIIQADRGQWQREAARELAAILDEHADLPAIAWTISRTDGITGGIDTLALAPEVRATFTAWQQALGLDEVTSEYADKGGTVTCLRARSTRGGVRVSIQAHLFTSDPEAEAEEDPVQRAAARPAVPARREDLRQPEPVIRLGQAPEGPRL